MTYSVDIPLVEFLDEFAWDPQEIHDLIQTTPLVYSADGIPVGYDPEQLFGFEAAQPAGRSLW